MGNSIKVKEERRKANRAAEEEEEGSLTNTYLEQVSKKIRKAYPEKGKSEINDLAKGLIDTEEMKKRYFNHLLKRTNTAIDVAFEEAESFPYGYHNEATKKGSQERVALQLSRVKQLEVKLLMFELQDEHLKQQLARFFHSYVHQFVYGPFHVAIRIGNIILEWDPSSLVIPQSIPSSQTRPNMGRPRMPVFSTILHKAGYDSSLMCSEIPLRAGAEQMQEGFMRQVNILLDISQEKEYLIDELAQVAVRYNKKFHYGLFSCNCQHFAVDVLQVLGIRDHIEAFKGKLKDHADVLIKRGLDMEGEFNSHQDLDEYVQANIDSMGLDDLEFCHCHYLLFHAWNMKCPNQPAWQCNSQTCQGTRIARQLE